ncbi:unnamed protein product [Urochloa decumbens]|uniref:Rx N-terminal domain-containing protein n=1 Tax=Urochloa decumbens TaxID=240449 RepID=A0ABC9B0W9_9POAL
MATILESLVGSCTKKLQDIITEEAILYFGVKEDLVELQRRMVQIHYFLNDAEQRSMKELSVNNWLGQLRDVMYDADDIIDLARSKGSMVLPDHSLSVSSKSITCSGLSFSSCFSNIQTRHEVALKIRSLNKRIDNIAKDKVFSSLTVTQPDEKRSASKLRKGSNRADLNLVGKEVIHACRNLVDLVLVHKQNRSYKFAIVGTGGVEKAWVAEGFIDEQDGKLLEDIAEEYYYELIYRNIFQQNILQGEYLKIDLSECRVHDLLRQLACHLSREECFVGDPESIRVNATSKFRRISVVTAKDMVPLPNKGKDKYKVRTWITTLDKPIRVDSAIFTIFPYIRVLYLTKSPIQSIPSCIGRLIHLRLLDLDGTSISSLPESIRHLINLQILNLQYCDALQSLPFGITRLCNLRRLGLDETPINKVPKGICRLNFLNDLEGFPVGGCSDNGPRMQDGWSLKELDPLLYLRKLDMIKLERASPFCTNSLLREKEFLKYLHLRCTEQTDKPYSVEDVINVEKTFELFIPPHNLEELRITGFFGWRYPTWLGASHLPSMQFLHLTNCKSCVNLPSIGHLPNLKYLKIKGSTAVTKIGAEFVGNWVGNNSSVPEFVGFPKLETLLMWDMPNWEEWTFIAEEEPTTSKDGGENGDTSKQKGEGPPTWMQLFPHLKELQLVECPKLINLPWQLGQEATSLKRLQLRSVDSIK